MKPHFVAIVLTILIAPAWSGTRTVTLSVPGMNCAACPITVKKALVKVAGVTKVDVSLDQREAVVTFDDTKGGVGQLTRATTEAGYPSTAKEGSR
jgi:periplasmic mercuric ion binding protein